MVKKTISELNDGAAIKESSALVAFEQNGATFSGTIRPNPADTIYAINQAQLEAELGPDLIIPAGESRNIVIDKSFSLTKPFKIQNFSSLLIKSQSSGTMLTYIGIGALIQMDGASSALDVQIENITLLGNFTNECFAVKGIVFSINLSIIQAFARVGTIESASVLWGKTPFRVNLAGLTFLNNPVVSISDSNSLQDTIPPMTAFSFISPGTSMDVIVQNSVYRTDLAHEYLFLDPNSPITSSYKILDSEIISTLPESMFQKGVDEAVTAVADNGSGKLRCTVVGHGQINNTYAALSGFAESTYNKTSIITVIDVDTFDAEDIAFVSGPDSGNINRSSQDSTDPPVLSLGNTDQPNSMFTGDAGLEIASPITIVINTIGVHEIISDVNWAYNNLERFEEDTVTPNQGRLINKGLGKKKYSVTYSTTIMKVAGGSTNIGIVLLKNGSIISFNPPRIFEGNVASAISRTEIIELVEDDVLQIAVINYIGTVNINVYQAHLSVNIG